MPPTTLGMFWVWKLLFPGSSRSGVEAPGHFVRGRPDVGEVGLAVTPQRRGDAHEDGVALRQALEVGGRHDPPAREGLRHAVLADVADVGLAPLQGLDLGRVD